MSTSTGVEAFEKKIKEIYTLIINLQDPATIKHECDELGKIIKSNSNYVVLSLYHPFKDLINVLVLKGIHISHSFYDNFNKYFYYPLLETIVKLDENHNNGNEYGPIQKELYELKHQVGELCQEVPPNSPIPLSGEMGQLPADFLPYT
jgi:hypothetical protein